MRSIKLAISSAFEHTLIFLYRIISMYFGKWRQVAEPCIEFCLLQSSKASVRVHWSEAVSAAMPMNEWVEQVLRQYVVKLD